jgi:hypothetical protein
VEDINEIIERSWVGKGGSVEVAAERAWENAKAAGGEPGTYEVRLFVETENPIRTYIVVIDSTGG